MFSISGSMGRECQKFYSRLARLTSEKRDLPQSIFSNWILTKVCFGLLKSSLLCLRGLRTVCRKIAEFQIDVHVSHTEKYKLVDNYKTNIDTFDFFIHCKLMTAAAYNLQQICNVYNVNKVISSRIYTI